MLEPGPYGYVGGLAGVTNGSISASYWDIGTHRADDRRRLRQWLDHRHGRRGRAGRGAEGLARGGRIAFKDAEGREVAVPLSFRGLGPALDALAKEKS